jgi:hypothetical protein
VPLIGNRLVELAQVHADDAEPLLAGRRTLFVIPVPSGASARGDRTRPERTSAKPVNPRESADAAINVLQELWRIRECAQWRWVPPSQRRKQRRRSTRMPTPPSIATCSDVATAITVTNGRATRAERSVYDLAVKVSDMIPTAAEAA